MTWRASCAWYALLLWSLNVQLLTHNSKRKLRDACLASVGGETSAIPCLFLIRSLQQMPETCSTLEQLLRSVLERLQRWQERRILYLRSSELKHLERYQRIELCQIQPQSTQAIAWRFWYIIRSFTSRA